MSDYDPTGVFFNNSLCKYLLSVRYNLTPEQIDNAYTNAIMNNSLFPFEAYTKVVTYLGEFGYEQELYINITYCLDKAVKSGNNTLFLYYLLKTNKNLHPQYEYNLNICLYHAIEQRNAYVIGLLLTYFDTHKFTLITPINIYIDPFWRPKLSFFRDMPGFYTLMYPDLIFALYYGDIIMATELLAKSPKPRTLPVGYPLDLGFISTGFIANIGKIRNIVLTEFVPTLDRDILLIYYDILLNYPLDLMEQRIASIKGNEVTAVRLLNIALSVGNYDAILKLLDFIINPYIRIIPSEMLYEPEKTYELWQKYNYENAATEYSIFMPNNYPKVHRFRLPWGALEEDLYGIASRRHLERVVYTFEMLMHDLNHYPERGFIIIPLNRAVLDTINTYLRTNGLLVPKNWRFQKTLDTRLMIAVLRKASTITKKLS